jgi:hypothetical protein
MKGFLRYAVIVGLLSLFELSNADFAQSKSNPALAFQFDPAVGSPYQTGTIDTATGDLCDLNNLVKTCFTLNNPSSIVTGHFTSSGHLDIAVINGLPVKIGTAPGEFKFYLSILRGNGDGTFADPQLREISDPSNPFTPCPGNTKNVIVCDQGTFLLAGDFNEDGLDDLAVVYFGNPTGTGGGPIVAGKVGIFLSHGDGTFADPGFINVGLGAFRATTGHFVGGHLDIAVVNREENSVSILLGDGTGGFTAHDCGGTAGKCTDGIGKKPAAVAAGHFDSDGDVDLAVVNTQDGTVTILQGKGTGTFAPYGTPTETTLSAGGLQPIGIIADDFNRDNHIDLAVLDQQSKGVAMFLGDGNGNFTLSKKRILVGKVPVDMVAADFNGDDVLDLAFVFFPGKLGGVFPGIGDGSFGNGLSLKITGTGIGNFAVAVGDFDEDVDHTPDLVIANGKLSVLLNNTPFPDPGFHITITDPTALTTWNSGSAHTVNWDSSGFDGDVRIDFSSDGGDTFKTIVKSTPNTPPFTLTKPPQTKTPINTARIRVCSVIYPGICGESDNFTLSP